MLTPYLIILFGHRLRSLPQCSLRVTIIREFNFVPLENQGKFR